MTAASLVYPMFAMVLLTATVLVIMFRSRVAAVREQRVPIGYFGVFQGAVEPESTAKPSRHFTNLFEAPTLFYVACLAAMAAGRATPLLVALAWAYVAARLVHAWIHLGSNRIGNRVRAYAASWAVLLAMWITLAWTVATA